MKHNAETDFARFLHKGLSLVVEESFERARREESLRIFLECAQHLAQQVAKLGGDVIGFSIQTQEVVGAVSTPGSVGNPSKHWTGPKTPSQGAQPLAKAPVLNI